MTKNNVIQRVLLFITAIPLLGCSIFFLPHQKHLFINLVAIIVSFLASKELIDMFKAKGLELNSPILPYLTLPLPVVSYLILRFNLQQNIFDIVLTTLIIFVLLMSISTRVSKDDFSNNIPFSTASIFVIFYPGYFMSYIIRFSEFENASLVLSFFILIVFLNDSGAWLFGVLFGKNNRGVVKVSKNKSIMGFAGGTVGTFLFLGIARQVIPGLDNMPLISYILLSLVISLVTITGDLVESAIKRSSKVKDSGDIIMGRGGVLDSIDSLLLAAPFFYYIIKTYTVGM